jgi:hypothetical protein
MNLGLSSRARQNRYDYGTAFGTEAGGRVLDDLIQFAGMGRELASFGPDGMQQTYIRIGMHRVILRIAGYLYIPERVLIQRAMSAEAMVEHDDA